MRFLRLTLCFAAVLAAFSSCNRTPVHSPSIPRDSDVERQVDRILSGMTLEEKIGQMLQINIDVVGGYARTENGFAWDLDRAKVDSLVRVYKVGSFLNAPGRAASQEQWTRWIKTFNDISIEHIGVPTLYGLDHNHGVTYALGGTLFPQPINIGASFNVDLVREMAEVTAYESRATDCPWVFNPVVDLGRDPRWSRIWESFGESPVVNARMVEAEVRAYQGEDPNHIDKYHVATSVKHYFGYGAPFTGKDRTPAYLSPQMLREKYFAPFKAAAEAGALTMMVNSASINGMPLHASYEYLTKWLKEDLNWDGMLVTDWSDINNLYTREKVAKDKKDAIRIAINAGIDMSMDPYNVDFCGMLKELVDEGAVKMSRIDDAVRRILRVKVRLGLLDKPDTDPADYPLYGSDEFAAKALRAAEESEVLLKNEGGILPLAPGARILLTGPNANQMRCLNGGWSYTWQGSNIEDMASKYNTIYEAFCAKFGASNVILEQGVRYNERGNYYDEIVDGFGKAVAAASRADVIVACIGENSYCETPGNLTDLTLSANQRELVKALARTGKPIVLVLNGGRPRIVAEIEPLASAVVDILLPSNYGGDALANLLSGEANFSAKLPYTYPREINSLANYDYKVSEEVATMGGAYDYDAKVSLQWPFGYGLSYTSFEYSNLRVDKASFGPSDVLNVSVDVKNTGSRAGKEAVLLYSSDLVASLVPDNRVLRAFDKVEIAPGQTVTVSFSLPASDLAFVGEDGKWILEEGDFILKAGQLTQQVTCTSTKKWETPNIL